MNEKLKLAENLKTQEILKKSFKNHSNPITKNLIAFTNSKIGDKFSIKDLLR